MDLRDQIQEIVLEFLGYGYRRVTAEPGNRGYTLNLKRVLRFMRRDNLLCLKKKFKPVITDSDHGLPAYHNLLKSIQTSGPNQVWTSDITCVQLLREHIYLAVIVDIYSRKCVG
jgi:putative transposase